MGGKFSQDGKCSVDKDRPALAETNVRVSHKEVSIYATSLGLERL